MDKHEQHDETVIELGSISEATLGLLDVGQNDIQQPGQYLNAGMQQAD